MVFGDLADEMPHRAQRVDLPVLAREHQRTLHSLALPLERLDGVPSQRHVAELERVEVELFVAVLGASNSKEEPR